LKITYLQIKFLTGFSAYDLLRSTGRLTGSVTGQNGRPQSDPWGVHVCTFAGRPSGRPDPITVDWAVDRLIDPNSRFGPVDRAIDRSQPTVINILKPINRPVDRALHFWPND